MGKEILPGFKKLADLWKPYLNIISEKTGYQRSKIKIDEQNNGLSIPPKNHSLRGFTLNQEKINDGVEIAEAIRKVYGCGAII